MKPAEALANRIIEGVEVGDLALLTFESLSH